MGSENKNNPNPNFNEGGFVTISGLTPDKKNLPYSVNTDQVAKFVQKKLNALQSKIEPNAESINVQILSLDAGRKFFPFVAVLSQSAAEEQTNKKRNTNADSFFTSDERHCGKRAVLKNYVYKYFENYTYDKRDKNAFASEDWRVARGVSRTNSNRLISLATPKFLNPNSNNGASGIYFLIDPIRVFHDMLRIDGDNRNFMVIIESWNKQENGVYSYKLTRQVNGKKSKQNTKIIDQLNYSMRNSDR